MEKQRLTYLLEQYTKDVATSEELRELQQFVEKEDNKELYTGLVSDTLMQHRNAAFDSSAYMGLSQKVLQIDKSEEDSPALVSPAHRVHFLQRSWLRYAAAILLLIGSLALWYAQSNKTAKPTGSEKEIVAQTTDIAPGTNRAILTVGNNQPIALANNKTGIAVGSAITYNDGERIADAGQPLTLTTPRGGQYQAVLPDGSKVWLNAASSIEFPSKFNGKERKVKVTGEVYMEVAQNKEKPFIVDADGKSTLQVLGTSFNINAYPDDKTQRTTLVSGSVKIVATGRSSHYDQRPMESVILKPGQRVLVEGPSVKVKEANIEKDIAWKNGVIYFDGATFEEIMRQVERWYDVEVVYENNIAPNKQLAGKMARGVSLQYLMRFIQEYDLTVELKGRTLHIKMK